MISPKISTTTVITTVETVAPISPRSSAFTLVPINENVDFGSDWENIRFHFTAVRDTFSVADESQMNIIQEIYAYEVTSPLDENYMYTCSTPEYDGTKLISKGPAYHNGFIHQMRIGTLSAKPNFVNYYDVSGYNTLTFDAWSELAAEIVIYDQNGKEYTTLSLEPNKVKQFTVKLENSVTQVGIGTRTKEITI